MSDPQGAPALPDAPITVRASFAAKGLWRAASLLSLFLLGAILERYFSSATVAAALAAAPAVAIAVADIWQSFRRHKDLRTLAGLVDDHIAQVKR